MSVIAELKIASEEFELGQIFSLDKQLAIELETLVPSGDDTVPLFWVYEPVGEEFLDSVERYPSVNNVTEVDRFEDRTLFKLEWDAIQDHLFQCIQEQNGQILGATGTSEGWDFQIRFSNRDSVGAFQSCCEDADISIRFSSIYNPVDPGAGPWYGLSEKQREALMLAAQLGYYDIPRGCTTEELADELGISDQAVTERLRRAIGVFARHALITPEVEA